MTEKNIFDLKGAVSEARARAKADADRRAAAGSGEKSVILNPKDVRGDYDAVRLLSTTLGLQPGEKPRALTSDDLAAFRHNANLLGKRFAGGVTPRNVIDMSETVDRKRAREQITTALPVSARGVKDASGKVDRLEVRFMTNASKDSPDDRHHVTVEFMGYPVAIASAAKKTAVKGALLMRKQNVRFDCDCGRHTFWYRYLATIGNYNAGRAENGYPKIRNPNLAGMACKHVLRVMTEIESGAYVASFLTRAVEKGRKSEDGSGNIRARQKQNDQQAEKQADRPTARGAKGIGDRDFERSAAALRKLSRATSTKPKVVASGSKRIKALAGQPSTQEALQATLKQLGISPEQAIALLQGMK